MQDDTKEQECEIPRYGNEISYDVRNATLYANGDATSQLAMKRKIPKVMHKECNFPGGRDGR